MIITMDGDQYQVIIPFVSEVEEFLESIANHWREVPPLSTSLFAYQDDLRGNRVIEYIPYCQFDYERENRLLEGDICCFRPILIPLDKDGNDISEQFSEENEDGVIVKGGIFSWIDPIEGYSILGAKDEPPIIKNVRTTNAQISDSELDENVTLKWYCLKGRLWCLQNLMITSVSQLEELRIVF